MAVAIGFEASNRELNFQMKFGPAFGKFEGKAYVGIGFGAS